MGSLAPFLLLVVLLVDGATRSGYSPLRNGVSQLVLGDRGWLARLTFVVCGLLLLAFGVGVTHTIRSGPGATWGSRLLGAVAGGLIIAGVFPTDPALGYPPGAVERISVAGGVHQVGGTLLFVGLIGAGIVFGSLVPARLHLDRPAGGTPHPPNQRPRKPDMSRRTSPSRGRSGQWIGCLRPGRPGTVNRSGTDLAGGGPLTS